jgi:hypothetical protein
MDTSEHIEAWRESWVVERDSIIGDATRLIMPDVSFVHMKPSATMPAKMQTMHEGHPWLHLMMDSE